MTRFLLLSLFTIFAANTVVAQTTSSPYSGFENRSIKALSSQQIADYRAGKGMSLALAAELNGYPGPRHVLDFAEEISLNDRQLEEVGELFRLMKKEASDLGVRLVEMEERLDAMFHENRIDEESLRLATAELADLQGQLRFTHLRYHLVTKDILGPTQVSKYNLLRGYGDQASAVGQKHSH